MSDRDMIRNLNQRLIKLEGIVAQQLIESARDAQPSGPEPRTLRDEVAEALNGDDDYSFTDAVLAVVKARLDALPRAAKHAGMCDRCVDAADIDALFTNGGAS